MVAIGLPVAGILALLVDWFTTTQLVRLWLQCTASILGVVLLVVAVVLRSQPWLRRLILVGGGLVLLLAVLDSLNGRQDWLPRGVVLLSVWALLFADRCLRLLEAAQPRSRRRWLAIGLAALATMVYGGVAGYYIFVHRTIAPVELRQHFLFGAGLMIATLVSWLGGLDRSPQRLTGKVEVCPACGLRNIAERTVCKRCRAPLGATNEVADNQLPA